MTQGLTPAQDVVLTILKRADQTPSYEEIRCQAGFGSKSQVAATIYALEARGFIERLPNQSRAIRVLDNPIGWDESAPWLSNVHVDDLWAELRRRGEVRRVA